MNIKKNKKILAGIIFCYFLLVSAKQVQAAYSPPEGSPMATGARPRLWFADPALVANLQTNATDDTHEVRSGVTFKELYDSMVATYEGNTTPIVASSQALNASVLNQAIMAKNGDATARANLITRINNYATAWKAAAAINTGTGQSIYAVYTAVSGTRESLNMLFALDAVYPDLSTAQKKNIAEAFYYMAEGLRNGGGGQGEYYNLSYSNRMHSHLIVNLIAAMFYGETSYSLDVDLDLDGKADTENLSIASWVSILLDGDGVSGASNREPADGCYPLIQHRLDVIENYDSWPEGSGYMLGENAYNTLILIGFFMAEGRNSSYYSNFWWKNFDSYIWRMSTPGDFRLDKFTDQTNTDWTGSDAGWGFVFLPEVYGWLYPDKQGKFIHVAESVGWEYPSSMSVMRNPFTLLFRRATVTEDSTMPTDFGFNNTGYYNWRTGYESMNDTSATFIGMDYMAGHQWFGQNGHIDLFHKGKLLITSGRYDSSSFDLGEGPYQKKSTAYNTILMYNSTYDMNDWTNGSADLTAKGLNVGSQMIGINTRRNYYEDTEYQVGSENSDTLDNVTHKPSLFSSDNGNGYNYAYIDYTASYAPETSAEVTREVITQLADGWMFVFDRVRNEAVLGALPKRALWHCNEAPVFKQLNGEASTGSGTINAAGGTAEWDSTNTSWVEFVDTGAESWDEGTGGKLFINTIIPTNPTIRMVGGPNASGAFAQTDSFEFYDPDFSQGELSNHMPHEGSTGADYWETGWGRIEVFPEIPTQQEYFLTAFQIGDTTDNHIPVTNITAIDSNHYGALVEDPVDPKVVIFSKDSSLDTSVSFTLSDNFSGTAGVVVANLEPGNYHVIKDGVEMMGYDNVEVGNDSTLYFGTTDFATFNIQKISASPGILRGDVDNNSVTNTTDALLTLRNSLGLSMTGTAWQIGATTGDVDCNGISNSTDAMLILRYSLGLEMGGTAWCE